jgi:hypothetical protein
MHLGDGGGGSMGMAHSIPEILQLFSSFFDRNAL